jgi:phospholipase/carboxylesterase
MPDLFNISGPSFGPVAGGAPRQLVLLLHGWGADGNDLIGLAPHLGRALPQAEFLSPHAPLPCETGYGRQWFGLSDRTPARMLAGIRAAAPAVDGFIDDELAKRTLDEASLALVGFSQGTMVSLHVALRRAKPVAGVVGFSGRLLAEELLGEEIRARPPVLLIHGTADEVLPVESLHRAESLLKALGVPVEAHARPGLGHGIDEFGLTEAARFLKTVFKA